MIIWEDYWVLHSHKQNDNSDLWSMTARLPQVCQVSLEAEGEITSNMFILFIASFVIHTAITVHLTLI